MQRILLLGGNGFIGRNLREYFKTHCPTYEVHAPTSSELNLLNEASVRRCLESTRFDIVIHAAICNFLRPSASSSAASELEQDLRMFFHLEKYKHLFGRLLYFGSGAEYDKRSDIASVTEEHFPNGIPVNDYGFAKYLIGKTIDHSENLYNFRVFGLFGKYENWRTTFISGACCKALKGLPITIRQNVFFDYVYIDDFCRIVQAFIDNTPTRHTYNIASGERIDLMTIAQIIKEQSKADVPIIVCKEGHAKEYTASNGRLLEEYPLTRFTNIRESIFDLLQYYRDHIDTIDVYSLLYQQ